MVPYQKASSLPCIFETWSKVQLLYYFFSTSLLLLFNFFSKGSYFFESWEEKTARRPLFFFLFVFFRWGGDQHFIDRGPFDMEDFELEPFVFDFVPLLGEAVP